MSPAPHDLKEMQRLDLRVAELQGELSLLIKQQASTHKILIEDNDALRRIVKEQQQTIAELVGMWGRAVVGEPTGDDYEREKALRNQYGIF